MLKRGWLTIVIAVSATSLFAMPVLSPSEPAQIRGKYDIWYSPLFCKPILGLKLGYRGDFVVNRKLLTRKGDKSKQFSFFANEAVLTFNFLERVDLYGFVGEAHYEFVETMYDLTPLSNKVSVRGSSPWHPVLGIGMKAIVWEGQIASFGKSFVALGAQYEYMTRTTFNYLVEDETPIAVNGVGLNYQEYQFSIALGQRLTYLIPYAAIQWASVHVDPGYQRIVGSPSLGTTFVRMQSSRKRMGWTLGVSLVDICRMDATAEVRFVEEHAFTLDANYHF